MIYNSERLEYRNFEQSDLEAVHRYASLDQVVKYVAWGPNTLEDSASFIEYARDGINDVVRDKYELAISLNDEIIGGVCLYLRGSKLRIGELGYTLNPKYWGNGYATEAAKATIAYGLDVLNLHRIEATCDVRNSASAAVLEKSGMMREGLKRSHILLRDGWRDSYYYGIIESD